MFGPSPSTLQRPQNLTVLGDEDLFPNKKTRKCITLEEKLKILNMYDMNVRTRDIIKITGFCEGTLRCIRKNGDKIRAALKKQMPTAKKIFKLKSPIMQTMELELVAWMNVAKSENVDLPRSVVVKKAMKIFKEVQKTYPEEQGVSFKGSSAWYRRFMLRHQLGEDSEQAEESQINSENEEQEPNNKIDIQTVEKFPVENVEENTQDSPAPRFDEIRSFAETIELQMQYLTTDQRFLAEKLIGDIIYLGRMGQLNLSTVIFPQSSEAANSGIDIKIENIENNEYYER